VILHAREGVDVATSRWAARCWRTSSSVLIRSGLRVHVAKTLSTWLNEGFLPRSTGRAAPRAVQARRSRRLINTSPPRRRSRRQREPREAGPAEGYATHSWGPSSSSRSRRGPPCMTAWGTRVADRRRRQQPRRSSRRRDGVFGEIVRPRSSARATTTEPLLYCWVLLLPRVVPSHRRHVHRQAAGCATSRSSADGGVVRASQIVPPPPRAWPNGVARAQIERRRTATRTSLTRSHFGSTTRRRPALAIHPPPPPPPLPPVPRLGAPPTRPTSRRRGRRLHTASRRSRNLPRRKAQRTRSSGLDAGPHLDGCLAPRLQQYHQAMLADLGEIVLVFRDRLVIALRASTSIVLITS